MIQEKERYALRLYRSFLYSVQSKITVFPVLADS